MTNKSVMTFISVNKISVCLSVCNISACTYFQKLSTPLNISACTLMRGDTV